MLCECGCGQEVKPGNRFINGHSQRGRKRTDAEKKHLSEVHTGINFSDEHKANISKSKSGKNHPMWGKHHPKKTVDKIRLSNIANRDKTSETMLAFWQDKEYREKMMVILRGPENLDRLRRNVIEQSNDPEYHKRISERMTNLWKDTQFRESLSGENANAWRGGKVKIVCETCGKERWVDQNVVDSARFCSQECCHAAWVGENNPNWAGGNTSDRTLFMGTTEYKDWRLAVFERDDYMCQECGKTNTCLNAHHILKYSDYHDHRTCLNNGITLCKECHDIIRGREENFAERYLEMIYIYEIVSDTAGTLTKGAFESGA